MSNRSQTTSTTRPLLRRQALEQAALHMTTEDDVATLSGLLDRARAYQGFLDGGSVETVDLRKKLLDIAHGVGGGAEGEVVDRAERLRRYVEEGA